MKNNITRRQRTKAIKRVESNIIDMLLGTIQYSMQDGFRGWYVDSPKSFIWEWAGLDPFYKKFIDEALDSLVSKEFVKLGERNKIELTDRYFDERALHEL